IVLNGADCVPVLESEPVVETYRLYVVAVVVAVLVAAAIVVSVVGVGLTDPLESALACALFKNSGDVVCDVSVPEPPPHAANRMVKLVHNMARGESSNDDIFSMKIFPRH
ncbi:hypothetical protein ACFOFO_26170, partial [Undibacterium arcticum]